ncbi:MAG: hypothetical protein QG597_2667 [Actinomycetota bacterium]|nr:hypothetical protein [Actinomycetota bacterium]
MATISAAKIGGRIAAIAAVTAVAGVLATAAPAQAASVPTTTSCGPTCVTFAPPAGVATGAADAAAPLNATLAKLPAGWTMNLPAGTYRVARPVQVPAKVTIAGAGMDSTRLLLDRRNWTKFGFSFVVTPAAGSINSTVRDLTIDGNRVAVDSVGAALAPAANQGGGIKTGNGWTVQRVRLSNLNYFKVWAKDVTGVKVLGNKFEDLGAGVSGGNDNIGGGGVTGVVMTGNHFTTRSVGNCIDFVRGSRLTIANNRIEGTSRNPHNLYLEGVTDSTISANTLAFSSISVQSNGSYASATEVLNPRGVTVTGNSITDPAVQGISLRYDLTRGTTTTGGGNAIVNNTITRPGTVGVITMAAANGLVTTADRIVGNTVTDAFARGTANWNCGYGMTQPAGISVGVAQGTEVSANKIIETRPTPLTKVGVQYGIASTRGIKVTTTTVTPNSVVRVATAELRV